MAVTAKAIVFTLVTVGILAGVTLAIWPDVFTLHGPLGCTEGDLVVTERVLPVDAQTGATLGPEEIRYSCEGARGGYLPALNAKLLLAALIASAVVSPIAVRLIRKVAR